MGSDARVRIVAQNDTAAGFRSIMSDANRMGSGLKAIFSRAFAGVAVGTTLIGVIKSAITYGDEIGKAATKSGIAASAMSELAHAAKQNDIELTSLSTALKFMQVELQGGGKAMKAIGVDVTALRAMKPDQQFEVMAEAISRLKDPAARASAAVQVFGRAGADLLPLLTQGAAGVRALRDEAHQLGAAMTDADVKRLQDADEAFKKMKASAGGLGRTLAIEVAPAVSWLADRLRQLAGGATELERLEARMERLKTLKMGIDTGSMRGMSKDEVAGVVEELGEVEAKLNRIRYGTGTGTRGGAKRWQDSLMADVIGTPEDADKAMSSSFAAASAAALRERARFKQTMAELEVQGAWLEERKTQIDADQKLTQTNTEQQTKEWEAFYAALRRLRDEDVISQETYLQRFKEQQDELLSEVEVTAKPWKKELEKSTGQMSEFAREAARNMQDSFASFLFDPFESGLKGMLSGFINTVRQMVAQAASAKIMEALGFGGGGGSGGGIFGTILGGIFGGIGGGSGPYTGADPATLGFATGGSFKVGGSGGTDSQLVRFRATPGEKVNITRPDQAASSPTINVTNHIDARGATTDLVRALPEILERNNQKVTADIVMGIRRGRYAV